jgi:hypothetical protein
LARALAALTGVLTTALTAALLPLILISLVVCHGHLLGGVVATPWSLLSFHDTNQ